MLDTSVVSQLSQIAAIASSGGFALATLNTKDFEGIDGLMLIDPSR